MKSKCLQIIFLLLLFFGVEAQNAFSDKDLNDFVSVYMSIKSIKKSSSKLDSSLFARHNISPERYRLISSSLVTMKKIQLSEDELLYIEEIKKQNQKAELRKENELKHLCNAHSLSYERYNTILHRYQTDIKFQRSIKPFFDHFINAAR